MKKIEVVEVYSGNNEIHFVLREHNNDNRRRSCKGLSDAEIKKIMKEEAAKPLLLLRKE